MKSEADEKLTGLLVESKGFERLRGLVRTLRGENGCPWDRKQTLETLVPHLTEEAAEVVEAAASGVNEDICEELGDTLMVLLMIAETAEQEGRFTFEQAVQSISEKLIRRHPHVFGNPQELTEDEIIGNWNKIKEEEKRGKR